MGGGRRKGREKKGMNKRVCVWRRKKRSKERSRRKKRTQVEGKRKEIVM